MKLVIQSTKRKAFLVIRPILVLFYDTINMLAAATILKKLTKKRQVEFVVWHPGKELNLRVNKLTIYVALGMLIFCYSNRLSLQIFLQVFLRQ